MNKDQDFENYLCISPNKLGLYLFDSKNLKNLYREELVINENIKSLDYSKLKKFLDNNIFKIEKYSRKFVENIYLVLEDEKVFTLEVGIKKKNYNSNISREYLENLLIEAKDLFRENYPNQEIMHMRINNYYINNKSYSFFEENLTSDYLALEIKFNSISSIMVYELNKILENYQIKVIKYLDANYIKNLFNDKKELTEMTHKILNGYNENEVTFLQKNLKKLGFFEKFFQLFS